VLVAGYTSIHIRLGNSADNVYKYTSEWAPMPRKDHSNKTRDVVRRLGQEGWIVARKGPGDHVQYKNPNMPERRVTIDAGAREIPTGTLRSIYKQAGWEW
jgi:predicted RNA binding protein YcfA (HicA-like mRNA interferase family)